MNDDELTEPGDRLSALQDFLRANAAEIATWPKWKREAFVSSKPCAGCGSLAHETLSVFCNNPMARGRIQSEPVQIDGAINRLCEAYSLEHDDENGRVLIAAVRKELRRKDITIEALEYAADYHYNRADSAVSELAGLTVK